MAQRLRTLQLRSYKKTNNCAGCMVELPNYYSRSRCMECKLIFCLKCNPKEAFCLVCIKLPAPDPFIYCAICPRKLAWCAFNTVICWYCDNRICNACMKDLPKHTVYKGREYIIKGRQAKCCIECFNNSTSRTQLPHIKAKKIIDRHMLPEVAQIIFDYYYKPRRYLPIDVRLYGT
jgi:hypothetical protein